MCTVIAGALPDYSFVATDLGVSTWTDGEMVGAGTSPDRLQQTGAGWAAGTGDGRLVFRVLAELDVEADTVPVSTVLEEHAKRRRQEPHEREQLENTTILTAAPKQLGYFVVGQERDLRGPGEFVCRTPPGVSGDEKRQLMQEFVQTLDPADLERSLLSAIGQVIGHVSERCAVTSSKFSIGGVARVEEGWKRRRCNTDAELMK